MRLLFIQSVSLFALALILAGCDSANDEPCTTDGLDTDEVYFVACLNDDLWVAEDAGGSIDTTYYDSSLDGFHVSGSIGLPPVDGPCDPYPCRYLYLMVKGQTSAQAGETFTSINSREGLQAIYSVGFADAPFADWRNVDLGGQPVAQDPTWLQITEFDTLNHVIAGTFELTLPKEPTGPGGVTPEEAGVPLPEVVRFREGRFRVPLH